MCQTLCFLALLLSTPFLTLGQKVTNVKPATKTIDLTNKTFISQDEGDTSKVGKDLHLLLLFHREGRATFRVKRENSILSDSPLGWRVTGDSLFIQRTPISITADGETQTIDRKPIQFFIVKEPGGYLLKDGEMIWIEQK